jgi:hypothetical protein
MIVAGDGLPGLPEAIEATWPQAHVQTCVVHLVRGSLRYASRSSSVTRLSSRQVDPQALRPGPPSTTPRDSNTPARSWQFWSATRLHQPSGAVRLDKVLEEPSTDY